MGKCLTLKSDRFERHGGQHSGRNHNKDSLKTTALHKSHLMPPYARYMSRRTFAQTPPCDGCLELRVAVSKQCKDPSKRYLRDPCLLWSTRFTCDPSAPPFLRFSISLLIHQSPCLSINKIALSGGSNCRG